MTTPETNAPARRYLLALGAAFLALHLLYALSIPAFSGPDEVEHRLFVLALVDHHRLPILDQLPRNIYDAAGHRIAVDVEPTGVSGPATPQAQQPPLPYLVYAAAELFRRAIGLPEIWLRLAGVLWGWIAMAALAALGRELFDDLPAVRDGLPACILLPGPVYLCSVISNDGAAMAAGEVILWRLVRGFRSPYTRTDLVLLGLAVGLGLAVKTTLLLYVPLAMTAAAMVGRERRPRWARAGQVLLIALLPVAWWYLRNHQLYGEMLVRAHARPTILSLTATLQASRDPMADLQVLTAELLITAVYWLPTCVAPLWLMLNRYVALTIIGVVLWIVVLLCLSGYRNRPVESTPVWRRQAERYSLAGLGIMFVMYEQQFLFQDFLVAVFAGRYFLAVYGCLCLVVLSGWASGLSNPHRPRVGHWLAVGATVLSLVCWHIAASPPPRVPLGH